MDTISSIFFLFNERTVNLSADFISLGVKSDTGKYLTKTILLP